MLAMKPDRRYVTCSPKHPWRLQALLAVVLGTMAAAEPPAPPIPAAPPVTPAVASATPTITLIPTNFQITQQVSFTDTGALQSEDRTCQFGLKITCPQRLMVEQMGGNQGQVELIEAETDSGESLLNDHNQYSLYANGGNRGVADFRMELSLKAPVKPITGFKRLAGVLNVKVASDKLRRIDLKPLGALSGTQIAIDGLDGVVLDIELTKDNFKMSGDPSFFDSIVEVKFFSPEGLDIENNGTGTSGGNHHTTCEYHVAASANGSASLFVLQGLKPMKIPFELKDIRLFAIAAASKPKTVIKSVEVDTPSKPAVPAGANGF